LVGEGKKFESNDALAYGKEMADRHIATLEAENQRYRDQADSARSQESLIEELRAELKSNQAQSSVQAEATIPSGDSEVAGQDVSHLVRQLLDEDERVKTANHNLAVVRDRMIQEYGDDWASKGDEIAASVGETVDQLNATAARSPIAFFKLAGLDGPKPPVSAAGNMGGTINPQAMAGAGAHRVKNEAYFTAVRKEMGDTKFYANTSLQDEMIKNANEMGESFFKT
jgi:hypothetical protein